MEVMGSVVEDGRVVEVDGVGGATFLRACGLQVDHCLLACGPGKAFRPDSGFQVWKAMDRNKHIYALSDGAVVAHSAHKSGGTWSGATENLKHGWVPLSVRAEPPVPKGNRKLIEKGGKPVDRRLLRDNVDLEEWLFTGRSVSEIPSFADSFSDSSSGEDEAGESSSAVGPDGSRQESNPKEGADEPMETSGQASSPPEGSENPSGSSTFPPE